MAMERAASLRYQIQNKIKDNRLAGGRDPKSGVEIKDQRRLEELRADWAVKKPQPKVKPNPKDAEPAEAGKP